MLRNETADSIRVNLGRIRLTLVLEDDSRQELPSLTSGQLADVVFASKVKDPSRRARLPIPLPSSTKIGHDKNWTELAKSAEEAGLRDGVIAPHSTSEGLLYFDLQGQFDLLNNARLYVPELVPSNKITACCTSTSISAAPVRINLISADAGEKSIHSLVCASLFLRYHECATKSSSNGRNALAPRSTKS